MSPPDFSTVNGKPVRPPLLKKISYWVRRLKFKENPHKVAGMLEIPLLSSMDRELLYFPPTLQDTPQASIDFAFNSLVSQFNRSEEFFNLNFHPWLIGTSNRLTLLEQILSYLSHEGVEFVLARDLAPE